MSDNQEKRINSIEKNLERIDATLGHVTDTLEKMAEVVNQPSSVPWGPIFSAIAMGGMLIGGYATIITQPMSARILHLEQQHELSLEREMEMGRSVGRLEGKVYVEIR